jgi:ribonuclease R
MLTQDQLLSLIRDTVEHPATPRELLQRLKIDRRERATMKRLLGELVSSGALVRTRGNRYGVPDRMNLVVGRITTNPRGFGFVVPDRQPEEVAGDIFIAGSNLNQAMHGDRVVARIERLSDRGAEGRIVRILERGSGSVVGRFDLDDSGMGFVVPFDRRLIMDVQIRPGRGRRGRARRHGHRGDHAVADARARPGRPRHRGARRAGRTGGRHRDHPAQVRHRGRARPDAVAQARRLGHAVKEKDRRGRTDFRNALTVTIDGEHARDFDDAITLEELPDGRYWLGVHIADVSHYVVEGSPLDEEAYERATSVYFPERAVHMFPEDLSTGSAASTPAWTGWCSRA